jgi:hypothetical protein
MHKYTRARLDCEQACKADPLLDARDLYRQLHEQLTDCRTLSEGAATIRFGSKREWENELMRLGVTLGRVSSEVARIEAGLPGALKVELLGRSIGGGINYCGE